MTRKRSKLVLPSPQISDSELEEVVKLGHVSETTRLLTIAGEDSASQHLLADYSITPMATPAGIGARTPHTPAAQDTILQVCFLFLFVKTHNYFPLLGGSKSSSSSKYGHSIERRRHSFSR